MFADFYQDLFAARSGGLEKKPWAEEDGKETEAITSGEIRKQLKKMAKHKAADHKGLVVEMLQEGSNKLLEIIADVFNDILGGTEAPPDEWKKSRIIVLYKKDDPTLPDNYRPITLLHILQKLFSKVICSRISGILDQAQFPDQAGFREGYSCQDHLHSIVLIVEAMAEFQLPLWVCAIDFKKAFDSVEHDHIWDALHRQNVPHRYIRKLAQLYEGQTATIVTDKVSKEFGIGRGTKQGDPISPKLFN